VPGVTIRYWRRCLGGSRVSAAIMARSGPVRLGAGDLTAQDRDLMPQYHDLRILEMPLRVSSASQLNSRSTSR
jgi:hypothetical protein